MTVFETMNYKCNLTNLHECDIQKRNKFSKVQQKACNSINPVSRSRPYLKNPDVTQAPCILSRYFPQFSPNGWSTMADHTTPSRHEKSLGLLTTKFVSLLQEAKDGVLDLKVVSICCAEHNQHFQFISPVLSLTESGMWCLFTLLFSHFYRLPIFHATLYIIQTSQP